MRRTAGFCHAYEAALHARRLGTVGIPYCIVLRFNALTGKA
jgi:hypothetical protein